jgi:hypothetical protein
VLPTAPRHFGDASIEVSGDLIRVMGTGFRAEADAMADFGECAVTPEFLGDPARLASDVLDTIVLFMLSRRGRIPIHAAGILDGDTAVVLAGPSGLGKSTLALASVGAGFRLLSDDALYVQTRPRFRLWGHPRPVRLLEIPAPYLAWRTPADPVRRGGRWKNSILLRSDEIVLHADRSVLCILQRGWGESRRMVPGEAVDRLMARLDPGFDHFADVLPAAYETIARHGAWELSLSPDAQRNVELIRAIVAESRA